MDRNLASILALAGTAAITFALAALAPRDAHGDEISVDSTRTQHKHLPAGAIDTSIDGLKRLYLECDRASVAQCLTRGEVMLCSTIYEALKRDAFDGDFNKLLAWSRAQASQDSWDSIK